MNQEGLSGLVGNIVFYTMNGKSYVRSRPNYSKIKSKQFSQSPSAQVFGTGSRGVSALLNRLQIQLPFPLSRVAYNHFRGWMLRHYKANAISVEWPISCLPNDQCQLQTDCDLRDLFRVQVSVEDLGGGNLRICIPAWNPQQQLTAPPNTRKLLISIMVLGNAFARESRTVSSGVEEFTIPYTKEDQPARETMIRVEGEKDDILILAVSLAYETFSTRSGTQLADAAWLPAAIIGVGRRKE